MTRETSSALDATRRQLLTRAATGVALAPLFASLTAGNAQAHGRRPRPIEPGELHPTPDETTGLPLLKLPHGFRYQSFGWSGDPMNDGTVTPDRHDGMAIVDVNWRSGELTLIRNHERGPIVGEFVPVIGAGQAPVYDEFALPGVVVGP